MRGDPGLLRNNPTKASTIAIWLAIAAYLALVIGFAWKPSQFAQALAAIGIGAVLLHARLTYGLRHALALFLICNAITFAMENLGSATGFPFGRFHFEVARNLPHIGAIPLVAGPLWFGIGYFSWIVAGILFDGADFRLQQRFYAVMLPIAAARRATRLSRPPGTPHCPQSLPSGINGTTPLQVPKQAVHNCFTGAPV